MLVCRGSLTSHLEQYVKVLQENSYNCMASEMRKRLHCLLGCLINQGLHHRDILECKHLERFLCHIYVIYFFLAER